MHVINCKLDILIRVIAEDDKFIYSLRILIFDIINFST